jgi:dolichol-phosphate mannosyltransferase
MLLAIPVYNEESNLPLFFPALFADLPEAVDEVLFINDGSSDASPSILEKIKRPGVDIVHHKTNQGYGQAMITAMTEAHRRGHAYLITMDCDRQHRPEDIRRFIDADPDIDVVSGSRYLPSSRTCGEAPMDRVQINRRITERLNRRFQFHLTDAFCGFKRYRMQNIDPSLFRERGYAFPMEFWAYAAVERLRIEELAVSRIYTTDSRSFGEDLDRTRKRYHYYLKVLHQSSIRFAALHA